LTFLSSFYLMLLSTCILLCANKHGWMDGWDLRIDLTYRCCPFKLQVVDYRQSERPWTDNTVKSSANLSTDYSVCLASSVHLVGIVYTLGRRVS